MKNFLTILIMCLGTFLSAQNIYVGVEGGGNAFSSETALNAAVERVSTGRGSTYLGTFEFTTANEESSNAGVYLSASAGYTATSVKFNNPQPEEYPVRLNNTEITGRAGVGFMPSGNLVAIYGCVTGVANHDELPTVFKVGVGGVLHVNVFNRINPFVRGEVTIMSLNQAYSTQNFNNPFAAQATAGVAYLLTNPQPRQ